MASKSNQRNPPQLACTAVALVAVLTHVLAFCAHPSLAATSVSNQQGESGTAAAATSTQPLWSYQVKPTNYVGVGQGAHAQNGGYSALSGGPASLFDAFTGLSQRQGALTSGSPFLSILPIILIAAGGLLLLLPMLTMMMASPFGGGVGPFGGGYQNYGGYPQVSGLNKRRSLDSLGSLHKTGLIELIEHVSSTIEDLSRKYAAPNGSGAQGAAAAAAAPASHAGSPSTAHKRSAKALNTGSAGSSSSSSGGANNLAANHQPANELSQTQPANHKPAATAGDDQTTNGIGNLVGGSL